MNILEKIMDAIYELRADNCYEEDIVIAVSPLTKEKLIQEYIKREFILNNPQGITKLMGCTIYDEYPHNEEIVVYDKKAFMRDRKRIIKL